MASRWSKRRKLHAEVNYYLDLVSREHTVGTNTDDCHNVNRHDIETLENLSSNDSIEVISEAVHNGLSSSEHSDSNHSQVEKCLVNLCPDVNSVSVAQIDEELMNELDEELIDQ